MNTNDPIYIRKGPRETAISREGYYRADFLCSNCHIASTYFIKKGYKTEEAKIICENCGCANTTCAGKVGFM